MTEEFDERVTRCHRTARFDLVPWLARLFGDGSVRGDSPSLPIGDESALTDETVAALQSMVNLASWKFLARECGWRKLHAVSPSVPESISKRRLWEEASTDVQLTFSTATPDFLISVFNRTRRQEKQGDDNWAGCPATDGDLLVHHLVFRRLHDTPLAFGLEVDADQASWLRNPLNALYDPLRYRKAGPEVTDWERLCRADVAMWMPWIGLRMSQIWAGREQSAWACGIDEGLQWLEAMTFLLGDWGRACEKGQRMDGYLGALDYLVRHEAESESKRIEFERENESSSLRDRQARAVRWIDFLSLTQPLEESAQRFAAVHPIERSGVEKAFLSLWEEMGLNGVVGSLEVLSQSLRPSFN